MNESAVTPSSSDLDDCDITFFIACYNEEANILSAIGNVVAAAAAVSCRFDIVVIDDASQDRSVERIRGYLEAHPDVSLQLIVNESNRGLGANYAEATFHGRGKYLRLVCGDDEERRESIIAVLRHLGEADMILSYHADPKQRKFSRRAVSRIYTGLVNLLSGYRLKYYNGLAVHRRDNAMRWHSRLSGFGFQADMITRLLDMGATYVEVPVVPKERSGGETKAFTLRNFVSVARTLLNIFVRRVVRTVRPGSVAKLERRPQVFESAAYRDRGARRG